MRDNRQIFTHESWFSQYFWVTRDNEGIHELVVDRVLKYENLAEDFARLVSYLGVENVSLPHANKSERSAYRDYYDEETRQIVADLYAVDIKLFGYAF